MGWTSLRALVPAGQTRLAPGPTFDTLVGIRLAEESYIRHYRVMRLAACGASLDS